MLLYSYRQQQSCEGSVFKKWLRALCCRIASAVHNVIISNVVIISPQGSPPLGGALSPQGSPPLGGALSVALQLCLPLQFGPLTYQPIE